MEIPGDIKKMKPDLVIVNRKLKTIQIIDATCPHENEWEPIHKAREDKLIKYHPLAKLLTDHSDFKVTLDAFVVGSLGTWDNKNWDVTRALGVSKRHATTLARLCVSSSNKWSRDIYVSHVTGTQQYTL